MTESNKPLIKPFWKSKTVLFNFFGALLLWVAGHEVLGIDAEILALIQSGVNIALRFLTSAPVTGGKNPGFAKFQVMVVIFIISLFAMVLSGCATFNNLFPPPAEPVCDRLEAAESVICAEFRERGIEPEQYENAILDVVAIGSIVEPRTAMAVKLFIAKTRQLMDENTLLTVASLFTWVQENEQQSKALASVINRRFPWLQNVDKLMNSFDVWLITEHLRHIEELL